MTTTGTTITADLTLAFKTLNSKNSAYTKLFGYYDGDQPIVYSSARLKEVFGSLDANFSENWCAVVVDAVLDRLDLMRFIVPDEAAEKALSQLWPSIGIDLDEEDVHTAALVCGESYVLAWREDVGDNAGAVEAYYHDPRMAHLFYEPDNPRKKRMGCKWWVDAGGYRRITLYYPDRLEYWRSTKKAASIESEKAFVRLEVTEGDGGVADNPFGVVPLFHFRPVRRRVKSDLENVVRPQDALNKLIADMMVSSEFSAFKQRYIISGTDPGQLKNMPGENWWIPAGDGAGQGSSAGQLDATDLGNFLTAIERFSTSIGVITRTPKHFFYQQGGDPSGEALIALEAPLNKKVSKRIKQFTPVWRELAAFVLMLAGHEVKASDIKPIYAPPETVQPKTRAEIRKANKEAGIPLRTQLREEGKSEKEIEQIEAEIQAERQAQMDYAQALREDAEAAFNRGEG